MSDYNILNGRGITPHSQKREERQSVWIDGVEHEYLAGGPVHHFSFNTTPIIDDLDQVDYAVNWQKSTIKVTSACTGQALYSAIKKLWYASAKAKAYPFPITAITPTTFQMLNGWKITTPDLVVDGTGTFAKPCAIADNVQSP